VPGHPFEALASPDGCWVFVSVVSSHQNPSTGGGGIAVLRWMGPQLALERIVPLSPPRPAGMALSNDGRLLVVADDRVVHFLDVARLVSGDAHPVLGSIWDARAGGSVYVAVSSDDRTLFVSDEDVDTVTVIDLQSARQTGFREAAIIGRIPTGRAPVGLALSRDGHYLFITSEVWRGRSGWPKDCRRQPGLRSAAGAVEIVDVARARHSPTEAVVGLTPAGCSPVRAVLSQDGTRLYVSARESNAVLVFDEGRLVSDPPHALLATVPVGTAPVGIEVVQHGERFVVANSSRFGGKGGEDLTVLDASKLDQGRAAVIGTIAVGTFPRELHATPDGQALLLTDYGSDRIELIPISRLSEP
jgi:DNA-binding beta-propeller fold protein YncE